MVIKRRLSVGDRDRRSRVSLTREVNIGLNEQAPRGELPSLDFDRVVNSYSMEATKKRLLAHHMLFASKTENVPENYRTFPESFEADNSKMSQKLLRMPYGKRVMTWVLTLLTGMSCGVVAILILFCVEKIVSLRSDCLNRSLQFLSGTATEKDDYIFIDRFFRNFGLWGVYLRLAIFNMVLAVLSSAMCVHYAPNAIGSGIPGTSEKIAFHSGRFVL